MCFLRHRRGFPSRNGNHCDSVPASHQDFEIAAYNVTLASDFNYWTVTDMKKLEAVEESRAIMTAGKEWGVFKWLMEKRKVRIIADKATAALNEAEDKVKATWSDELKKAYNHLATQNGEATKGKRGAKAKDDAKSFDAEILAIAQKILDADEETEIQRLDAEDTFAEGERQMSTSMAREGAGKALATYDLHEKAIRKAEAAAKQK
jgi:hypothetical protein